MKTKREQRVRDLIDQMTRERGYLPAQWPYAIEKDVDFMEVYNKVYNSALNSDRVLPIKTRELIAIALLAFRNMQDGFYPHMKRALRYGATKEEIFESLKVSIIIGGGAPSFANALQALLQIEEEEKSGRKGRGK